ncbi:MAG TPA: hypothetical protein DC034_04395 [Clostridium sp.]|jgi:hypothetical protein|uniref:Uncharacterized protein n=1 Tax=Clostridium lapidicellarium TaxID=3240931 RepID=A0ABV4DUM2_9CLOT|nr:hypothetical protein [uncultured Clostridium sp.]NLU07072.1 hypothetical protein [Clostridiales bacterium]HBC96024.1 hypothetical protein [Clostridium sp.]
MKISHECWQCGCEKLDYGGSRYCVFDSSSGPVIMKDEPDECLFVDKDSHIFGDIYDEFQKKGSQK